MRASVVRACGLFYGRHVHTTTRTNIDNKKVDYITDNEKVDYTTDNKKVDYKK
jgi:hypothetical protein